MSKYLTLTVAALLVSTVAWAHTPKNTPTARARDDVSFQTAVKVGNVVLKAGEYQIVCNAKQATFERLQLTSMGDWEAIPGQKPVAVAFQEKLLPEKKHETETDLKPNGAGPQILQRLYLSGSNVEYDFAK